MYQRYIANPDGTFRKTVVDEPPRPMPPPPPEPVCAPPPPRPELACPPERPRPVSYTHLTLPTSREGEDVLVDG